MEEKNNEGLERSPSVLTMVFVALHAPVYSYPRPFIPTTCIRRRRTSNGYVHVCEIDPAIPPTRSLSSVPGGLPSSVVSIPLNDSKQAKLSAT